MRKSFTQRVVIEWNRLPRKVEDAPDPGSVQGHIGWGPEQQDLLGGTPGLSREVGYK